MKSVKEIFEEAESVGAIVPEALTKALNNAYDEQNENKLTKERIDALQESIETDDELKDSTSTASAFEINLAEFPITHLSTRLPSGTDRNKMTYCDYVKGPDGIPMERTWIVRGGSNHGLGGPSTLQVLYEVFQIWREQGFKSSRIHIGTYYNLLKRLGKGTGKREYERLRKNLECIRDLKIDAQNALYDPETGCVLKEKTFGIFTGSEVYGKKPGKINASEDYVFIQVDENFYESIKKKAIVYVPFDAEYFKTLKPTEQKLGLYLAKIFSPYKQDVRMKWTRRIDLLAEQLPLAVKEPFMVRRQLKRICEGLLKNDFPLLSHYEMDEKTITFYNSAQTTLPLEISGSAQKDNETIEYLIEEQLKVCKDQHSKSFYAKVARLVPDDVIYQCLSEAKAEGKDKKKLYTKLIIERGGGYIGQKKEG